MTLLARIGLSAQSASSAVHYFRFSEACGSSVIRPHPRPTPALRFGQKHVLSLPVSLSGTIVTVCTANICRSPMAAALLQHAFAAQPEPWRSLQLISAGVAARPGEAVSENSVLALKKVGLDISNHRS